MVNRRVLGTRICMVPMFTVEQPTTEEATPSAAAEEAISNQFKSPTYLTNAINFTNYIIFDTSSGFITSQTNRTIPRLT